MTRLPRAFPHARSLTVAILVLLLAGILGAGVVLAQTSPIHPTFPLLDEDGVNVLVSGKPVSTMATCGSCHDTEYIASHSFHATVGLEQFTEPGQVGRGRAWEMSTGLFGGWDPITYRYLTPKGDERFDLGTPDWLMLLGVRHPGGGPAMVAPDGTPLPDVVVEPGDPTTHSLDPEADQPQPWDWNASGVEEMNCFLCHLPNPDNQARTEELQAGRFQWANTATLQGAGLVERTGQGWQWNREAFQEDGSLKPERVTIQDPGPENCGQCHGTVYTGSEPMPPSAIQPNDWHTQRTGQLFSGQRLKDTGLNLAGKDDLGRSFDIHAERDLECVNCHYSVNNPVYYQEAQSERPEYLEFDPRRLDLGEYLLRPSHQFAKGSAAQHATGTQYKEAMRRCESCHNTETTHEWLPYKDLHMSTLSCETCHIPQLYEPAIQQNDWTVITPEGTAQVSYRGVDGPVNDVHSLVTGYEPVLLWRGDIEGRSLLAPFNLISSWYWVQGDPERPVRLQDLKRAYLDENGGYRPEILAAFDADQDGQLDESERRLDSDAKVQVVKARLESLGLVNPRIRGEIQPYSINHDVTYGEWATKDCETCHNEDSRITRPFLLASYVPGNVTPQFLENPNVRPSGQVYTDDQGRLYYQADTAGEGLYVPGHDRVDWVNILGWLMFLGTLGGVVLHGGLRVYEAARHAHNHHNDLAVRKVYMYTMYERFWHWLQAFTILLLMATGIVIHRPDALGWADFGWAVPVHNVLAFILLANAVFAAFYHFASGEIRQYLPEPRGYFRQALIQAEYYLRGIFRGEPHPFEKTPEHKLNPLQQATYFAILNILLPLQIVTGLAMWGAQRWPEITARLGGLPWLAPFHTLIAWLFASFVVLHVYLTTTGHTPLAAIKAMTVGWDEVETHEHPQVAAGRPAETGD